jgi:CubicO group peptidase (beta-lactamase class C family)
LIISFLGLVLDSAHAATTQTDQSTKLTAQVDDLFAPWNKHDSPGAALGIFKDGKILYAKGYGTANLDYGIPMSPQTVLRTGSITKQFIAMGVALLAEQGKLSTTDNIRKYLPEMPEYDKPITLAHLLHHTSGIREYLTLVSLIGKPEGSGYVYTPQGLLSMLARQRALDFNPGDQFSYSNSGYFLLAEIINRVSGTSASSFLNKHIFEPLGMDSTRLHDDPNAVIRNRGVGYSPLENGGYRLDILRLKVIGDLGLISSVEDFLKWDQNFYNNTLGKGSPALIETVLTTGILSDGENLDYAFGLRVASYRGLRTVSHGGSAVGYVAHYLQFPEQHFSVIILSNVSSFSPAELSKTIADLYLADDLAEAPISTTEVSVTDQPKPTRGLSPSEVTEYAANYYSDELDIVYRLRDVGGTLDLTINAMTGPIRARAKDHLSWSGGADFHFARDSDGEITGFLLQSESVRGMMFTKIGGE